MPSELAIVIPTHNEAENLPDLLDAISQVGPGWQVVVVDDGSPDGTARLAREWAELHGGLTLIERQRRRGLGSAYKAGLGAGLELGTPHVLTMDADFSHDPQAIPHLVAVSGEADVVVGSRYVPGGGIQGWGWERHLLSGLGNWTARTALGLRVHDCTAGFRCYRREVLERVPFEAIRSEGYSFLVELLWLCQQAGYAIAEVPIVFRDRRRGASKISWHEIYKALFTIGRLRLNGRAAGVKAREATARRAGSR